MLPPAPSPQLLSQLIQGGSAFEGDINGGNCAKKGALTYRRPNCISSVERQIFSCFAVSLDELKWRTTVLALIVIVVCSLYAYLIFLTLKKASGRIRVALLAVLLGPLIYKMSDIPVGYVVYRQACRAEEGLRVYRENNAQAISLRLENYGALDAKWVLQNYPDIESIEAIDESLNYTKPPIYTRYFRDEQKGIRTEVLDRAQRNSDGTWIVESGTSHADYIIKKEHTKRSIRLLLDKQILTSKSGLQIAKTSRVRYQWTDPDNTPLSGRNVSECGRESAKLSELIDLISNRKRQ
jgi:hypothetical protein